MRDLLNLSASLMFSSNASCLSLGIKYAAFQSCVLCPANVVRKIPGKLSFEEGCVLPPAVNIGALWPRNYESVETICNSLAVR